jgi:hypothetical protein
LPLQQSRAYAELTPNFISRVGQRALEDKYWAAIRFFLASRNLDLSYLPSLLQVLTQNKVRPGCCVYVHASRD